MSFHISPSPINKKKARYWGRKKESHQKITSEKESRPRTLRQKSIGAMA